MIICFETFRVFSCVFSPLESIAFDGFLNMNVELGHMNVELGPWPSGGNVLGSVSCSHLLKAEFEGQADVIQCVSANDWKMC